jgi:F-type H+-transporting ATPase subunit a
MSYTSLSKTIFLTLATSLLIFAVGFAQHKEEKEHSEHHEAKKFDPGQLIMHHIAVSHEWEFAHGIVIPLPVILYTEKGLDIFMSGELHHAKHIEVEHKGKKEHFGELTTAVNTYLISHDHKISLKNGGMLLDLSITKNVAALFICTALLLFVFLSVAGAYNRNQGAPRGMQSLFEPIIVFIRDEVAKPNIGHKYERYLPYLLTIFFFIWFNNLLGLLPGWANVTGNIAITLSLAVITFLYTNLSGNKNYWGHIFNPPGVPAWLLPLMIVIEIIGIFTKPFALTIRLFANITGGHIIILSLLSLIFIFQSYAVGVVSTVFAVALTFLELLVAILQAYIFTLLSAIYIGSAIEEHHHEGEHEHDHAH